MYRHRFADRYTCSMFTVLNALSHDYTEYGLHSLYLREEYWFLCMVNSCAVVIMNVW